MRSIMRGALAAVVLLMAAATSQVPATADETGMSATSCYYRDEAHPDSGVTKVDAYLYYCEDWEANRFWFEVKGTLYDTNWNDGRPAYVNLKRSPNSNPNDDVVKVNNGDTPKTFYFVYSVPLSNVHLMTRACSITCSSKATGWLYS